MSQNAAKQANRSIDANPLADDQGACMTTAAALGASWCDFVGERFHAYAHVIDDVSHCHDLTETLKVQSSFGQQSWEAYRDQAARVSGLMIATAQKSSRANSGH
jgi:hypothetical protein